MRVYKSDGSFVDEPNDIEFGWYFDEIAIDEGMPHIKEINMETRVLSRLRKTVDKQLTIDSFDIWDAEPREPVLVEKVTPNIKTQPIAAVVECKLDLEGTFLSEKEPKFSREMKIIDCSIPGRDRLASLINPCNLEAKMLLSVIHLAKYRSLLKKEGQEMFRSVSFNSNNFKCLIEDECRTELSNDMYTEIQNYHATKEENMLSLMMELILTDMDCKMDDVAETASSSQAPAGDKVIPHLVIDTSDLGNSIQSSCSSKFESSERSNYLEVPNRSSILSSIGLSDEDRSIRSFCEETIEMHLELTDIKKSFQNEENRVGNLIKDARDLEKQLKEILYLDDILHLLNGRIDKVRLKKLPFRTFYRADTNKEAERNFIV